MTESDPASQDSRTRELAEHLSAVRRRLDEAVAAAAGGAGGRGAREGGRWFPADDVARLISLGERSFGESREPEASRKIAELRADDQLADSGAVFDMIGSVQSKKAKSVASWARMVHSVDREKVVDALSRASVTALDDGVRTAPLGVLLQVSLDGDVTRGGVLVEDLPALADRVIGADGLALRGLMVIAPVEGVAEQWMARTAEIRERFLADHPDARELSAGMSGDLEPAVAHGSTCVRVGTAIMGSRPLISQ
ncbi:alanine racemase [Gordonia sp. CPCC 205515]|uniref:YggS family pyridoxal phosphate enzyme n=1 Tax=Gordonia sp. CPCC 205515 TaxID=3140791 RepID=UPI003AF3E5F4